MIINTDGTMLTISAIEDATGWALDSWKHQCHGISLAIVKSGLVGESRVVRGFCDGIASQHSWVILGNDAYARDQMILDCSLWSYVAGEPPIWTGYQYERHTPHGSGNIFDYGKPKHCGGETVELDVPLSREAAVFMNTIGPLDHRGWMILAKAPVGGWPAKEIIGAMADTPRLAALVPIDILGMVTDRNPQGLYMSGSERYASKTENLRGEFPK